MSKPSKGKFVWIPRVIMVLFILFLSLFSLDVFGGDAPLIQKIGGFLIHTIPSFMLAGILIIFWKRPLFNGIALIFAGTLFTIYFGTYDNIFSFLILTMTLVVCGILFIISHVLMHRKSQQEK